MSKPMQTPAPGFRSFVLTLVTSALALLAAACSSYDRAVTPANVPLPETLAGLREFLDEKADAIVFTDPSGSAAVVSPRLQGRLLTLKVGAVESTGFVSANAIAAGDISPQFNNFGGIDRFWLGPEAGQFGIYFPPGADLNRKTWTVPRDFDTGPFHVLSQEAGKLLLNRDMTVRNYLGHDFEVNVKREVGLLTTADLRQELGVNLPSTVAYAGVYSFNLMTNIGKAQWQEETGLIGIWILGQFTVSDETVVVAPFRPGDVEALGPRFDDDYFGKVSVESPGRLKVLGNAVLFRGDGRRVGKFGISQRRTTGLAGAMDFSKNLLTIVKFDVPSEREHYGNSHWDKIQAAPFAGDAFQSYNNGNPDRPGELAGDAFYELESASPVRPLAPGESLSHRHATHQFQGGYEGLAEIARQVLGVELDQVKAEMLQ